MVMRRHDRERYGAKIPTGKRRPKQFEVIEEIVTSPSYVILGNGSRIVFDEWAKSQVRRIVREISPEPKLTKAEREQRKTYGSW
jgi:hypothetical protein